MLNLDQIPDHYLQPVRSFWGIAPDDRALDHEIAQMTPEEFVRNWLIAKGILGQTVPILGLVAAAYSAGGATDEFWSLTVAEP